MSYNTIEKIGKGEYKSRGSKFFAFTHSVDCLDSYKHLISVYRSEYPESCHICSAYRILINKRLDEYGSDDGAVPPRPRWRCCLAAQAVWNPCTSAQPMAAVPRQGGYR